MKSLCTCVVFAMTLCGKMAAEIRLPHLFSDHAVLQRERPVHVWGWATPGASLSVRFHEQTRRTLAGPLGKWEVTLEPEKAGGPYVLSITGDGQATVQDILVGDVWLAGGQSNMEMPLKGFGPQAPIKDGAKEIAAATHPEIRLLTVGRNSASYPVDDIEGSWQRCTPETAASFSAVAYFFGREIAGREHVPVGLIASDWGGTPADAWTSMDTLGTNLQLLPAFHARAGFAAREADAAAQHAVEERNDNGWKAQQDAWIPSALFNGMIAPLTPYTLRGFLWYQGEANSDADRAEFYATLFQGLIQDWRMHFGQGDLPFLFAQISAFDAGKQHMGMVRDAQRRALGLRNTAMAVTLDVGEAKNIHPADKQTVGARLALAARAMVYGEPTAYASPNLREVTREPGGLRVWFDHGDGLSSRGKPIEGFEVAGADHTFVPAHAVVEGDAVAVSAPGIAQPVYVRYLWQNFPPAPLYNRDGLPASTFSSEWSPSVYHP